MHLKIFWAAIVLYLILRAVLFYAQYKGSPSPELRARVEKHFTGEDIEKGFEYGRRGFGARAALAALDLLVLLIFLQSGAAAWLSERLLERSGGRWPLQAGLFAAVLVLGLFLLHLPFDHYLGFVLEHRFGFSNQTAGGWLVVQAKNLAVGLVLSVLAALLWFGLLRSFPRGWALLIPGAFTVFELVLALLVPLLLLPLFYTKSPLPEGPFREKVVEVLRKGGIGVREVFVIDESRYSKHTNAFFTGLGPTKNIYLYDTLLKDHSEGEALTVVAHEAGHWRGRHVLMGLILGALGLLAGCLFLWWFYPGLARSEGGAFRPLADPGSLPAVLILALLGNFFASPIASWVSRGFEREADRAAVMLTGDAASFVEAEVRLARTNRSQLLPHPLAVFWYASHPPAIERIAQAEELAAGGAGKGE